VSFPLDSGLRLPFDSTPRTFCEDCLAPARICGRGSSRFPLLTLYAGALVVLVRWRVPLEELVWRIPPEIAVLRLSDSCVPLAWCAPVEVIPTPERALDY
jgi:hypothetical protein